MAGSIYDIFAQTIEGAKEVLIAKENSRVTKATQPQQIPDMSAVGVANPAGPQYVAVPIPAAGVKPARVSVGGIDLDTNTLVLAGVAVLSIAVYGWIKGR